MKIVSFMIFSLLFIQSVFAEKVIVVYKSDKSVSIITPVIKGLPTQSKYDSIYEDITEGTELEGLPYDVIDSKDLPDSTKYIQESWEGEKGKGVLANTVKDAEIKSAIGRKRLIDERKDSILEAQAISELFAEGLIE